MSSARWHAGWALVGALCNDSRLGDAPKSEVRRGTYFLKVTMCQRQNIKHFFFQVNSSDAVHTNPSNHRRANSASFNILPALRVANISHYLSLFFLITTLR